MTWFLDSFPFIFQSLNLLVCGLAGEEMRQYRNSRKLYEINNDTLSINSAKQQKLLHLGYVGGAVWLGKYPMIEKKNIHYILYKSILIQKRKKCIFLYVRNQFNGLNNIPEYIVHTCWASRKNRNCFTPCIFKSSIPQIHSITAIEFS